MKAGFKRVDITPQSGIPMGGNCREDSIARGVHDPLYADIMVLDCGNERMVFVDLDWCEAPHSVISGMKKDIEKETGVRYDRICITMTHTHSAPDTFGYFSPAGIIPSTQDYIDKAASDIAGGMKEALLSMEEVLIGSEKGYEDKLSFNRRVFFKDGSLHMNWEILDDDSIDISDLDKPEGPIDPDVYVIKICNASGRLKAIVVNFTLHPAVLVMKDWLFSKDYILGLEESLHSTYGKDVFIYFANGAEGNINHINMWDKNQGRGWEEAKRIGAELAEEVKRLVDTISVKQVDELKVRFKSISIPIRNIPEKEVEDARKLWKECGGKIPGLVDGIPPEWYAGNILKIVKEGATHRQLEFYTVKIGDIVIATLPGEVFVEFGLKIKGKSPYRDTMLFGLANQSVGYIPTVHAFSNYGGYETVTCESSILVPDAGEIIVREVLSMIDELE